MSSLVRARDGDLSESADYQFVCSGVCHWHRLASVNRRQFTEMNIADRSASSNLLRFALSGETSSRRYRKWILCFPWFFRYTVWRVCFQVGIGTRKWVARTGSRFDLDWLDGWDGYRTVEVQSQGLIGKWNKSRKKVPIVRVGIWCFGRNMFRFQGRRVYLSPFLTSSFSDVYFFWFGLLIELDAKRL